MMRFRQSNRLLKFVFFALLICVILLALRSINFKEKKNEFGDDLLSKFYKKNNLPKIQIRQNGEFWILQNYIIATKQFGYLDSITYTTHGEFTFLDNVEELVKRWQGPISLAIFAPHSDFYRALNAINYLRRCSNIKDLINERVTFHVIFPSHHMPAYIPRRLDISEPYDVNCNITSSFAMEKTINYRHNKSIMYPINLCRNVARQAATTYFIFPSDIEMYPNMNFIEEFIDLVHRRPEMLLAKRRVYPLAVFEVNKTEEIPNTKTDLQEMLFTKKAVPFHKNVCMQCHAIPGLLQWVTLAESAELDIFAIVRHRPMWEPFYVTTNDEPLYDERYMWEGRYDKQIQADLLGMLRYDFYILNNAFLVHRPGIKTFSLNNYSAIDAMKIMTEKEVRPQLKILFDA